MRFRLYTIMIAAFVAVLLGHSGSGAGDFWISGSDASVVTNNDCGFIAAIGGRPTLLRSFQDANSPGVAASITDRVNSGDEVRVPEGSRLELVSGANVVLVFGEGSRVKFQGLRNFAAGDVREASRLDIELLAGEVRVQVRLNQARPESVLLSVDGNQFLMRRGDATFGRIIGWQATVLSGDVSGRVRRTSVLGAPFELPAGTLLGVGGQADISDSAKQRILARLPFSFETIRAALPPLPSLSYELEAP